MSELAVGLMSGTSLDGVDAALVEVAGAQEVRLLAFHTQAFAAADRTAILRVIDRGSVRDVALLNAELGRRFAAAALAVLEKADIAADQLAVVASHGQTLWHEPGQATLQVGDPSVIAETLGVPVVSDFRGRDIAAGGQGAPLVPLVDAMLFGHATRGRALLNIGGMANLTWVPRRGSVDGVLAFDTGPGVAILDAVTRRLEPGTAFDVGGTRASRGRAVAEVVEELLEHPYFAAPPPKSTGRETFGEAFAKELLTRARGRRRAASVEDCIATALELTVRSIAGQLARWVPAGRGAELVVSGGGSRNPELMARLRETAAAGTVRLFEDLFFDGDAKEAVAFAYLGWCTLHRFPGNVPSATGADGARVLGSVTPGGPPEGRAARRKKRR